MKMLWKGVTTALIAAAVMLGAVPAQAQYYGDRYRDGYRSERHYDGWNRGRYYRGDGWNRGRYYRGENRDRRHWRARHHRERCWTEWRYSRYYGERVRVRRCR